MECDTSNMNLLYARLIISLSWDHFAAFISYCHSWWLKELVSVVPDWDLGLKVTVLRWEIPSRTLPPRDLDLPPATLDSGTLASGPRTSGNPNSGAIFSCVLSSDIFCFETLPFGSGAIGALSSGTFAFEILSFLVFDVWTSEILVSGFLAFWILVAGEVISITSRSPVPPK